MAPEHKRLSRYGTLELRDILELPVSQIVEEPAHLYLWVPNALLSEGLQVMERWGFTYDPADPFPTLGGANLLRPAGPFDQRPAREGRADYVLFVSEPLDDPLEATGRFRAVLYVSTDAPDTDFTAKLLDVYPAGDDREILMLDGIRRVKLRNGFEQAAPLLTSNEEVVKVSIDL